MIDDWRRVVTFHRTKNLDEPGSGDYLNRIIENLDCFSKQTGLYCNRIRIRIRNFTASIKH